MKARTAIVISVIACLWCSSLRAADYSDARERNAAKIEHLKRTSALIERLEKGKLDQFAQELTAEDFDALLYSQEPALGPVVLNYCLFRFGKDLKQHSDDPESFRKAMEYLEAIRFRPCAEPFALAIGKMSWKDDKGAIPAICAVLKSIAFNYDSTNKRGKILSQLLDDYSQNVYYIDGPGQALKVMGDESTVIALVDILEQTGNQGVKHNKSHVLTVIINIMKPTYRRALARLVETIRNASDPHAYSAMEITLPYESLAVDTALIAKATNKQAATVVRGDAIRTIGLRKLARYRDLIESIGREEKDLHQAVAQALKDIGGQGSLPLLASYLDDPEYVRIYAAEAIGIITDQSFGANDSGVAAAAEWWKEQSNKPE